MTVLAILVPASTAYAHAQIVRSDPPDGSQLAQPPREVRLWYSEPIVLNFSRARLLDGAAREIPTKGLRNDPADPHLLIFTISDDASITPLSDGVYSLSWKVLSADGHYTTGYTVFSVGSGVPASAGSAAHDAAPSQIISPVEVALRWLNYTLLAMATGSVLVATLVIRSARRDNAERALDDALQHVERRMLGWAIACAIGAFIVGIGWLAWQVVSALSNVTPGASPLGIVSDLLSTTQWGALWLIRQGLLVLLAVALVAQRRATGAALTIATITLGLATLLVQALTGHALALQTDGALAVVADVAHLIAVGVWIGGLAALSVGLLVRPSNDVALNRMALLRLCWKRFSLVAAISVAVIISSGLYSTGRQVASLDALLTTVYGQAVIIKVGLVIVAGALGLLNSMLLHPRVAAPLAHWLHRPVGWTPLPLRYLPTLALAELSIGLLVFGAAGVLTAAPPAHGPEFAPPPEYDITSASRVVNDMLVSISVKPNLPGQNVMDITAASTRRPAPAEVLRVIVRMQYKEKDIGLLSADAQKTDPDHYLLGGNYLSLTGAWDVSIVVRRKGLEDAVADFDWHVPPAAPRPVILSNHPWEPALTLIAAALLLGLAALLTGLTVTKRARRKQVVA